MNNPSVHYSNIDWIRALSSLAVVALHYKAIPSDQSAELISIESLFNGYVLRLAVPLFMLVSLFLFTSKERSHDYLLAKVKQLFFLALIWSAFFYLLNGGLLGYVKRVVEVIKEIKASPLLLFHFFFTDLETVFYFFISLPIILIIAFLLQNRSTACVIGAAIASILAIAFLPFIKQGSFVLFYNPANFIPYAPIAILINRYNKLLFKHNVQYGLLLVAAGFMFSIFEFSLQKTASISLINGYTRNSLVALSTGIFLLSLSTLKTNKLIVFMSQQSLPLYLFHTCLYTFVGTICDTFFTKLMHIPSTYNHIYAWLVAVALCYFISTFIAPRILLASTYNN